MLLKKPIRNIALVLLTYFVLILSNSVLVFGISLYSKNYFNLVHAWSLIRVSFLLPTAFFSIPAGIIADRNNKKNILTLCLIAETILFLTFYFLFKTNLIQLNILILCTIFVGISTSFFETVLETSAVEIGKEYNEIFIPAVRFIRAFSYISGPIIAKYFDNVERILTTSMIGCLLNFLGVFIMLKTDFAPSDLKSINLYSNNFFKKIKNALEEDFKDVLKYFKTNKFIVMLLILNIFFSFFYMPMFDSILPTMCKNLKIRDETLMFLSATTWIGSAIGAFLVIINKKSREISRNFHKILIIEGFLLFLWTIPAFFNISNLNFFYFVLILFDGILCSTVLLGILTYFQIQIPASIRGKLLGIIKTTMGTFGSLGILIYSELINYSFSWQTMNIISSILIVLTTYIISKNKNFKVIKTL